ncbi:MAG TPA: HtaA domain-containing protein [Solirubrobacterales bacterium]|nr:HtaA domain-containing protein [Solirubrobacterales bacterium]
MAPNDFKQGRVGMALVALTVAAMAALSAAPASATTPAVQPIEGSATVSLAGQKGGVQELPIVDLELGRTAVARTSGVLKLSLKGRRAKLRKLALRISDNATSISARLGKERLVVFRAEGKAQIGNSSVKLAKAPLSLTGAGAEALRSRLDLDSLAAGEMGTLSLNAKRKRFRDKVVRLPVSKPGISLEGHALPAQPEEPKPDPDPYPYAAECPVASVEGGPGFGDAPGEIAGIAPAPVFNPGTSQEVTGTSIEWGFLQSFRNYVLNVPTAGSLQTLDGASASAAGPAMAAPGQFFDFPVDAGTYERGTEADHSDDRIVADGDGTVLFCKSGHGFNIVFMNPTVTIDGDESRITADVGANMHGTWYPFQRVDLAELDLSSVEPTLSDGGNTIAWEDVPVKMSADGAAATGLGGNYPAGTVLDTITVETTLDRPLLAECGVEAGIAAPPTVDFTLAALPTLTNPVVRSGKGIGTINWGFRRSTRNTVASPGGAFLPLGGATEAFPGSMGGSVNAFPPAANAGLGKFFRFPISSYAYEAGTVDPGDDRLIATSNATVGFCKPNTVSGNFGLIVSKPTLIVDGANSRIVANAYSFAGPFMAGPAAGWTGGRVELVNLDTSAIDITPGVGTVKWGEVNADFEPLQNGIPVAGGLQTEAFSLANLTIAGTAAGGFDPVAAQIVLPAP